MKDDAHGKKDMNFKYILMKPDDAESNTEEHVDSVCGSSDIIFRPHLFPSPFQLAGQGVMVCLKCYIEECTIQGSMSRENL